MTYSAFMRQLAQIRQYLRSPRAADYTIKALSQLLTTDHCLGLALGMFLYGLTQGSAQLLQLMKVFASIRREYSTAPTTENITDCFHQRLTRTPLAWHDFLINVIVLQAIQTAYVRGTPFTIDPRWLLTYAEYNQRQSLQQALLSSRGAKTQQPLEPLLSWMCDAADKDIIAQAFTTLPAQLLWQTLTATSDDHMGVLLFFPQQHHALLLYGLDDGRVVLVDGWLWQVMETLDELRRLVRQTYDTRLEQFQGVKFSTAGPLGKNRPLTDGKWLYVPVMWAKKTWVCPDPQCCVAFTMKANLDRHICSIHSNTAPFKCSIDNCDRAFSRKDSLTKHIRTHTGENPYQCKHCDRKFSDNSNFRTHAKKNKNECNEENCKNKRLCAGIKLCQMHFDSQQDQAMKNPKLTRRSTRRHTPNINLTEKQSTTITWKSLDQI